MKVAFAMFDKDGDGVITCAEVLQVMVSLGIDVDSDEVKEIVRKIDLDGMYTQFSIEINTLYICVKTCFCTSVIEPKIRRYLYRCLTWISGMILMPVGV